MLLLILLRISTITFDVVQPAVTIAFGDVGLFVCLEHAEVTLLRRGAPTGSIHTASGRWR